MNKEIFRDSSSHEDDHKILTEQEECHNKDSNAELVKKIAILVEKNNQKDILIVQLQRRIKNLEIALFSGGVPPSSPAKPLPKKAKPAPVKVAPQPRLQVTPPAPKNKLKKILSHSLQKSILFGGKFIKNAAFKKKLRKLSRNPYSYFADSKCKFLRPLRNLFERP